MKHRRSSERRALSFSCEVVRQKDFSVVATAGFDVSKGGLRVYSDAKLLTGEELFVSVVVPGAGVIASGATVARMIHGRRPIDHGKRSVGVVFNELSKEAQVRLNRLLSN